MKVENEKMPEMSKDEVMSVAKQLGASDKLLYRLRTLVGRFDSGRLFLIGKDMDYKKFVKYGPRMKKLVTAIKEKCYFLQEEKLAVCEHDERCEKWMREKEREYEEKVALLNPVFKCEELQRILEICKGNEFVDLLDMNMIRRRLTLAHQERLCARYKEAEAERQRMELEELDRVGGAATPKPDGERNQEGTGNGKK